jgi:hypothetical protein
MSRIDKIVIVCHKGDLWLTKICVASIRYWYPDRELYVFKDLYGGDFSVEELQKYWNVKLLELEPNRYGTSISKIALYLGESKERILAIDSDLFFAGFVLEKLESLDHDFVVNEELHGTSDSDWFKKTYYDYDAVKNIDPEFNFPGYTFNGGQIVLTSAVFKKDDFSPFVDWSGIPGLRRKDIFSLNDQGLLNYFLPKHEQSGRITVGRAKFMHWSEHEPVKALPLSEIINRKGIPFMIHWAGTVAPDISKMTRSDIVSFFQKQYYSRVPLGELRRTAFNSWKKFRYGGAIGSLKRFLRLNRS